MNGEKFEGHASGLKFRGPRGDLGRSFANTLLRNEMKPWGQLLSQPQFRSVKELRQRAEGLVSVADRVIQDRDLAAAFGGICDYRRLVPVGRLDGEQPARTVGHAVFATPDFTIELLKAYDDSAMLGVRWWNRGGTEPEFGGEVFGVRMVCVNYNLWGPLLGRFHLTQKTSTDAMLESFDHLLNEALDKSPILRDRIEAAQNEVVPRADLEDLLFGINLRPVEVSDVSRLLSRSHEVSEPGLTTWTLYNAVTSYATHRPLRGADLERTEAIARDAVLLLTAEQSSLLRRVAKIRMAFREVERPDARPLLLLA